MNTWLESILTWLRGGKLSLSNLIVSPAIVEVSQVVTVKCTATNNGGKTQKKTIKLKVEGSIMASQTVTLNPGQSQVVSFQVTPTIAKNYTVAVDGLTGTFQATAPQVADIRLENLVISPSSVLVGQTVSISVTATNYGNAAGSKTITCTAT